MNVTHVGDTRNTGNVDMEIEEEVISTNERIIIKFIFKNRLWCCEHVSVGSLGLLYST
jgi:hypothetical protein